MTKDKAGWQEIFLILAGCTLLPFIGSKWSIPVAAWIAPILILRFFRRNSIRKILFFGIPLMAISLAVAYYGIVPFSPPFFVAFILGWTAMYMIPFFVDRYLYSRISAILSSLVFPLAMTSCLFLLSFYPFGTWVNGAFAYSQYGQLPLLQLVSVTGIWGLSFLIFWLAPVLNDLMDDFSNVGKRRLAGIYSLTLCFILIAGGVDTACLHSRSKTVRVASITIDNGTFNKILFSNFAGIADREDTLDIQDRLFTKSEIAVQNGAKILFWPEMNGMVLQEDEAELIERGKNFAEQHKIYFFMSLWVIESPLKSSENKVVAIGPDGAVLFTYLKSKPFPGDPYRKGDGVIKSIDTEYGRLSCAICFDMDFPALIRQAGKLKVDILIVPADDTGKAVDPVHTEMSVFRALENGFSMVRQDRQGLSMAVDYQGNVISSTDYFNTWERTMISNVPVAGRRTFYSIAGDWFGYLCLAAFVIMTGWLVIFKKKSQVQI